MLYFKSVSFLFFLLFSVPNFANNNSKINWWNLGSDYKDAPAVGWQIFTFIVFLYLIGRFAKKPLNEFLRSRSIKIEDDIMQANETMINAKNENSLLKKEKEVLINKTKKIEEDYIAAGKVEKKKIINSAKSLVKRIKNETKKNLEIEILNARKDLKLKIIKAAMLKSKIYLKKNITINDDIQLQKSFVKEFENIRIG